MDIFQFAQMKPVRVVETPRSGLIGADLVSQREPVLFDKFDEHWSCARRWTLDWIGAKAANVKVSRPSADGIYRYHQFESIPFTEFARNLETSKDVYLALDPIYRANQKPHISESLKALASDLEIPDFIDQKQLRFVNLWVGPGGNKTLLHFDPWDGLLIVLKGRKRFAVFNRRETSKLHGYSIFNLRSIFAHAVLDSRINPADIDCDKYRSISEAHGIQGVIEEGQALFLPAGTWHYIESEGVNIAVNFFWRGSGWTDYLKRPLIGYRIKRSIIVMVAAITRFVRTYIITKRVYPGRSSRPINP
jgi:hypothetical protein